MNLPAEQQIVGYIFFKGIKFIFVSLTSEVKKCLHRIYEVRNKKGNLKEPLLVFIYLSNIFIYLLL